MSRWLVVLLIAGCWTSDDAGESGGTVAPRPQCPPLPSVEGFDFYGEGCTGAGVGVLTVCHDGADDRADRADALGWCIEGTCRPQSGSPCPRCPAGTVRTSTDGARYCAP